jgi:hypothetical protein
MRSSRRGRSMDELMTRFSQQGPVAVMARLGLQRAIGSECVNDVFEGHSENPVHARAAVLNGGDHEECTDARRFNVRTRVLATV